MPNYPTKFTYARSQSNEVTFFFSAKEGRSGFKANSINDLKIFIRWKCL